MTDFDPKDYREHVRERLREEGRRREPELRRAAQAAVAMHELTGSREWDYFVTQVAALREAAAAARDEAARQLASPEVVAGDALVRAKIAHAAAVAQITALDAVIALPKEAMAQGEAARRVLDA